MRHPTSNSYIAPVKSDGTEVAPAPGADASVTGRGVYTLLANTTYYFPVGGQDCPVSSVHLQHDAAIAITTAQIEDCNQAPSEATNFSAVAGVWLQEDPTTAFVATAGATTSHTNGVVAVVAGNLGGAMWHVADTGARRTRLAVAVGATGGEVRVAAWGKE